MLSRNRLASPLCADRLLSRVAAREKNQKLQRAGTALTRRWQLPANGLRYIACCSSERPVRNLRHRPARCADGSIGQRLELRSRSELSAACRELRSAAVPSKRHGGRVCFV